MSNGDVDQFVAELDKEADQEAAATAQDGSYFGDAPGDEVMVRRAREYDDLPKHVVRRKHWLTVATALHQAKGKGLRLLTLPGRHALEVALYEKNGLLERTEGGDDTEPEIYVVGFETSPEVFGLLQAGRFRFKRLFDGDLVQALADGNSKHRRELAALFPFDVVNLDLTVNLVAPSEGPNGPVLIAIRECFKLQGAQQHDWALMLTFRAGLAETDQNALDTWRTEFQRNLDEHPAVKEACHAAHGSVSATDLFARNEEEALSQFAAKWIVDQAHAHDWKVVSSKHLRYHRDHPGGRYSIRKIVFRFSTGTVPRHTIPTRRAAPLAWHIDDLVTVVRAKSIDIEEAVNRLRTHETYWKELETEIEELRARMVSP